MKFVFLGSGAIAKRCLEEFLKRDWEEPFLAGVSAPHDILDSLRRHWRGPSFPKTLELSVFDRKETELLDLLKLTQPRFMISVQYPWILSRDILAAADQRVLNVHNAKLPEYRGHNTISHEILNGEREHVSSLHWIEEKVDRGILVKTATLPIKPDDTAYSLWKRTVDASVGLFCGFMEEYAEVVSGKAGVPIPSGGRYYPKNGIAKLKEIPVGASLENIDRIARAFWFPPHEPAYLTHAGRKIYVMPHAFNYSAEA